MSKGLKIFEAKHELTDKDVFLNNIQEEDKKHLICKSCGTKLKFTKGHYRLQTWVSSFFSLSPTCTHESHCEYNISKAIEIMVRESISVEGSNIQTLFKNEINCEFRLNVLTNSLKNENRIGEEASEISLERKKASQMLSAYLRTASGIVKLWTAIQDNKDREILKNEIQIVYNNEQIPWNKFVFEYHDLDKVLPLKPKYPIAIIVVTKNFDKSSDRRKLQNCIQCRSCKIGNDFIVPRIFYNGDLFKEGRQYLVVGNISVFEKKEGSKYVNLSVFVNNQEQVTVLNDENRIS